ncbi:MAG: galactose-1-phosphate uridylyltransferase [Dehalococcoidales bacterium]|nr:galactose-1-phosphate uridylyltransferase [Dehalococcoidales bacterium]
MPELRQDSITSNWVVIATDRAKRPENFTQVDKEEAAADTDCPFCYGNEQMTPPEVMAYRAPDTEPNTPGWKVRIIPNKFPAFVPEETPKIDRNGVYVQMNAAGAHEVIIYSPDHNKHLALLSNKETVSIVAAFRDRYIELKKDKNIKYILFIVNHGKKAGASLEHPHAQLFASPMVPINITNELRGAAKHFKETNQCIFCNIIQEERKTRIRVIMDTKHFLAFCPFASRSPFETWIIPKKHASHFENMSPPEINNLASIMRVTLAKLYDGLNNPDYNFYVHTSPCHSPDLPYYHWHIEILPKLTIQAGYEMGSGIMINIVRPEDAAAFLKKIEI